MSFRRWAMASGIAKGRADLKHEIAESAAAHQALLLLNDEEERASQGIHV